MLGIFEIYHLKFAPVLWREKQSFSGIRIEAFFKGLEALPKNTISIQSNWGMIQGKEQLILPQSAAMSQSDWPICRCR